MGGLGNYNKAFAEMRQGKKVSHWIWFVWPCLKKLRPNVQRPEFSLPDMCTAQAYLKDTILATRLLQITQEATLHLCDGVKPNALFGTEGDALKFHETMTMFSIAATESREQKSLTVLCEALRALSHGALEERTVKIIAEEGGWQEYNSVSHINDL